MRARTTCGRRRDRRGFTLVEILIATLCFAIIVGALNSAFYGSLRLRAKTTKLIENSLPITQAANIIRRDLQGIMAPGGILAGSLNTTTQSMGGTAQGLAGAAQNRLVIYTSTGVVRNEQYSGDVQKVAYYLRPSEFPGERRGMELVRAVTRNLLPVTVEDYTELPLLEGVRTVEYLFYDGYQWQPSWDGTNSGAPLPQAIKVSIQMELSDEDIESGKWKANDLMPIEIVAPVLTQALTNTTSGSSSNASSSGGSQTGGNSPGGGQGGGNTPGGGGNNNNPTTPPRSTGGSGSSRSSS